ncbi:hypothetical protein FGO68_gene12585 [Halteria grandinella]|uniref:Uncharacterized protein n=1 Tax=Halteria grandinella TaxID=5974 RepID=A0A8J8NG67_HALGN|nr:hypothetical protein FGO68_gene12585 [Halteria grandinella]
MFRESTTLKSFSLSISRAFSASYKGCPSSSEVLAKPQSMNCFIVLFEQVNFLSDLSKISTPCGMTSSVFVKAF